MTARHKFLALLKEDILQVGLSELDFGLYRILNYKRTEIEAFLEEELPAEIGRVLRALPGAPSEDEEARLYNALYTFFSRYFVDADFMPRARRGRDAAYSLPYDGADTLFHWASKGSHYVKSGERFAAYVYTQKDGARVRFAVVAADTQKDNAKGERRYYLPAACHEETVGGRSQFRVEFAWRPLVPEEARRYAKGRAKADEDTADEGSEAQEGRGPQAKLFNAWLSGSDFKSVPLPSGLDRESLERQLRRYVHGQDSDFFVHPRLAAFLTGELDYFLKNEFMNVWDLPDGQALLREREKLKAVRTLASAIIRLLAAIEDVQAILFEKRKFVLSAHYLAQCSWLQRQGGEAGRALVAEAMAEPKQVAEWRSWVNDATADGAALLARYPHLPLNTAHFGEDFKWRLLASFPDIAAATGGVLIHGDNYAALRTLEPSYREAVKCIYIDPPYNTDASPIAYKNDFRGSSWISLLDSRLDVSKRLLDSAGVLITAIDDAQSKELLWLLNQKFEGRLLGSVTVRSNPSGRPTRAGFSVSHEYLHFSGASEQSSIGKMNPTEEQQARFSEEDDDGVFEWRNLRREGSNSDRLARPALFYPFFVTDTKWRVPKLEWDATTEEWVLLETPNKNEETVYPIDDRGVEKTWRWGQEKVIATAKDVVVRKDRSGKNFLYYKRRPNEEGVVPTTSWFDSKYSATEHGTALLKKLFGKSSFSYPKSLFAVEDALYIGGASSEICTCLDFFAGSGTTGHAVMNLNREDGGARKFILVEQGEYFHSVLLPRIAKVMACPSWKEGKPKDGVSFDAGEDEAHWSRRTLPLVQVLNLERYEDSLDALELPAERQARQAGQAAFPQLERSLRYLHDASAQGSTVRLATEKLARPFDYRLPLTHEGRYADVAVDLVHTGFLLAGLHPLRLRRMEREGRPVVLAEARPQGAAHQTVLVLWREVDDSLAPKLLLAAAQAEYAWLRDTVSAAFGHELSDYAVIWHNRDLMLLGGETGRSLDAVLAEKMWERA
jgi:adenine-specific DNA-methyltransferase